MVYIKTYMNMNNNNYETVLEKFDSLEKLLRENVAYQREMLSFEETCKYLNLSASYLYKLTSRKGIPHYSPSGKKLYFKRSELDQWLQQKRVSTNEELVAKASEHIMKRGV
jgi:excisionase family DNA binding protein